MKRLFFILVLLFTSAACATPTPTETPTFPPYPDIEPGTGDPFLRPSDFNPLLIEAAGIIYWLTPKPTATPTSTGSPYPTDTPTPTDTPIPTATCCPEIDPTFAAWLTTPTNTPTITPTPIPTLDPEDEIFNAYWIKSIIVTAPSYPDDQGMLVYHPPVTGGPMPIPASFQVIPFTATPTVTPTVDPTNTPTITPTPTNTPTMIPTLGPATPQWNASMIQSENVAKTKPSTNDTFVYDGTKWAIYSPTPTRTPTPTPTNTPTATATIAYLKLDCSNAPLTGKLTHQPSSSANRSVLMLSPYSAQAEDSTERYFVRDSFDVGGGVLIAYAGYNYTGTTYIIWPIEEVSLYGAGIYVTKITIHLHKSQTTTTIDSFEIYANTTAGGITSLLSSSTGWGSGSSGHLSYDLYSGGIQLSPGSGMQLAILLNNSSHTNNIKIKGIRIEYERR